MLRALATDPVTYGAIGGQITLDLLIKKGPKFASKFSNNVAKVTKNVAKKVIERMASKDAMRITERAGVKVIEHAAERAGIAAATKLGTQTAVAAETGPGFPFVEAAEIAFNMLTGYMDEFNLGGFQNMTNMTLLNSMRDQIDKTVKDAYTGAGEEWPVIYGPFSTINSDVLTTSITALATSICENQLTQYKAGLANGTILPPSEAISDDSDQMNAYYLASGINVDLAFDTATQNKCVSMGGVWKKHPNVGSSNMVCTWESNAAGKCLSPWPLQVDDTYYEYDSRTKTCQVKSSSMRTKCENLNLGVTYNFGTGSCNLSSQYCTRYGADNGLGSNGDCAISKGEEIAEMIFGTTFTRSLVNIFSPNSYAPCPPGAKTVGYLCEENKCPAGQEKVNGICYDACPSDYSRKADSLGTNVPGFCYKCPAGFMPSTLGICHKNGCPPGKEPGTGIGVGFCYDPCPQGQSDNGAAQCSLNCPVGYDTSAAVCYRGPVTVTDGHGITARCPSGWATTVTGPGGMCQAPCPPGQKKSGALCYDNNVPSPVELHTSYVPEYTCPSGWWNSGLLCNEPIGWNDHCHLQGTVLLRWWIGCASGGNVVHGTKQGCKSGYRNAGGLGVCWAVDYGGAPIAKSITDVGQCDSDRDRVGGMCYKKCSDASWGAGQGFTRSAAGSCLKQASSLNRSPSPRSNPVSPLQDAPAKTIGPQNPKGISLHTYGRHRSTPFPSTSENDFKNSTLGSHIQNGINAARNGDIKGLAGATAAAMLVANPMVVGLGAGQLVNLGTDKIDRGDHKAA